MRAARRTAEIQPFVVMDVLARAHEIEAAGRRVVHMEIGEPDFTAPEPVVEAAMRALRDGRSAYTPTLGLAALREEIAGFYSRTFQKKIDGEPRIRPRVRLLHAARTCASVGWKFDAGDTASGRATPSKARTMWR